MIVSIYPSSSSQNLSKDDKQPLLTGQFLKMEVLLGATGLENRGAGRNQRRIRLLNGFFLRINDLLRCSVCLSVCCGSRDSWLLPGEILIWNNISCQGDRPNIIIAALAKAVRRPDDGQTGIDIAPISRFNWFGARFWIFVEWDREENLILRLRFWILEV